MHENSKLDDLPDFVKIQFYEQKYDFWHSVQEMSCGCFFEFLQENGDICC